MGGRAVGGAGAARHARSAPSSDALASSGALPRRAAPTSFTIFEWPLSERTSAPASASHTAQVASADAVASWPASDSHATRSTAPLWPRKEAACAQLAPTVHNATERSREEDAIMRPLGEKDTDSTSPACAPSKRSVGHSRKDDAAGAADGITMSCASRWARFVGGGGAVSSAMMYGGNGALSHRNFSDFKLKLFRDAHTHGRRFVV